MAGSTTRGEPMDLSDLLYDACQRGFTHDFSQEAGHDHRRALGERLMTKWARDRRE
jgi:hypothetical protein